MPPRNSRKRRCSLWRPPRRWSRLRKQKPNAITWAGVIAVVDDGGWSILLVRMDNAAYVASVELALGKARTAALFKKPSEALEDAINHGRIAAVTARDFIEMKGGLPITVDGQVIGGIGASFDTPEHDEQIAKAGLAAFLAK